MVVLSVAIVSRGGKILLSRQFVEASRLRVEGLLAAFTKLIGGETSSSKQHTFVETDSVRYVYLPLESVYVLLITNKGSNIIEDLDTLRFLSKVVTEQLHGAVVSEETIALNAFEILFAVDEVVSASGYREELSIQQVRTNLEMDSHEERLAQVIKASKMTSATDMAKKRAQEIRQSAMDAERIARASGLSGGSVPMGGGRMGSISSSSSSPYDGGRSMSSPYGREATSFSSSSYDSGTAAASAGSKSATTATTAKPGAGAGGMKLGAKKGAAAGGGAGLSLLMAEEGLRDADVSVDGGASSAAAAAMAAAAAAAAATADHASIVIEEKVGVVVHRNGTLKSMEVMGSLSLTLNDEAHAKVRILLQRGDVSGFQFQTHPRLNKPAFTSEGVLAMKSPDVPFPVGVPLEVVRWVSKAQNMPLNITFWPQAAGGGNFIVSVEYALQDDSTLDLTDVTLVIPLGSDAVPVVRSASGNVKHNARDNCLVWQIDAITPDEPSGSLEFSVRGKGADQFYPVSVNFSSLSTMCPLSVKDVISEDDAKSLRYKVMQRMISDNYILE